MLNEQIIKVFKSWLDDNGISYDEADEEMWLNELLKFTSDNAEIKRLRDALKKIVDEDLEPYTSVAEETLGE